MRGANVGAGCRWVYVGRGPAHPTGAANPTRALARRIRPRARVPRASSHTEGLQGVCRRPGIAVCTCAGQALLRDLGSARAPIPPEERPFRTGPRLGEQAESDLSTRLAEKRGGDLRAISREPWAGAGPQRPAAG